jgi:magnesium-transporting ATPase (P-type)
MRQVKSAGMDRPEPLEAPFWSRSLQELRSQLGAGDQGMSDAVAQALLAPHGENVLHTERRRAVVLEYLAHFRNPLVLLLLAASAASTLLGDVTSFVVIALIVIGSVTLDFVQERRAANAAVRLRESVALSATVLRDGTARRLPASQIVPGDTVKLAAGDLVPADGRIVDSRDFFVRQSALTGESFLFDDLPPMSAWASGCRAASGAPIVEVPRGMLTECTQLRSGNIVTKVNGRTISCSADLVNTLLAWRSAPGTRIVVHRAGKDLAPGPE